MHSFNVLYICLPTTLMLRLPLHDGCKRRLKYKEDKLFNLQRSESCCSSKTSRKALGTLDTTCLTSSFGNLNLNGTKYSPSPNKSSRTSSSSLESHAFHNDLKHVSAESGKDEIQVESGR